MRIIRSLVLLAILFVPMTPHIALADGGQDSSEIQIKLEINNIDGNLAINSDLAGEKTPEAISHNFEGYAPAETLRQKEVKKLLAKYGKVMKDHAFPEGKFSINASAYTAAADECGKSDGVTASGLVVLEGETIACPPQFPLGTKLDIDGIGTRICEDRGGAIKGNHVDIYVEHKKDAFQFGRQILLAEVVK